MHAQVPWYTPLVASLPLNLGWGGTHSCTCLSVCLVSRTGVQGSKRASLSKSKPNHVWMWWLGRRIFGCAVAASAIASGQRRCTDTRIKHRAALSFSRVDVVAAPMAFWLCCCHQCWQTTSTYGDQETGLHLVSAVWMWVVVAAPTAFWLC